MNLLSELQSLYEFDSYQWLLETIKLLKSKRFELIDLEHLIEELEDLGRSERNAVESLLEQIMRHLLLLQYWSEESPQNSSHWKAEIIGFRSQLKRKLTTNLRNYLEQELDSLYQDALAYVQQKTSLKVDFPQESPYSLEQLLDLTWLP